MNNQLLPLILAGIALGIAGCVQQPTNPAPEPAHSTFSKPIPGQYLVILNDDVADAGITSIASELATRHGGRVSATFRRAVRGFAVSMSAGNAARLARDPRVRLVEPDVEISARPINGKVNTRREQATDWGVTRVGGSHDGAGHRVWIIDSGIDLDHPDLNVDLTLSANFVDGDASPDDLNGHGTHVAGIVAAKNNGFGTIGVAADATVIAVRVLDRRGNGTASTTIAGVEYVLANMRSGDVANMSLGGGLSATLDAAVLALAQAGVRITIASGNDGADCTFSSPARVNHTNVFTVSAIDRNDVFASFSNYGWGIVDYAAPGVDILSSKKGGGTTRMSGTSMAAPHVAGLLVVGSLRADAVTAAGDPDGQPDPIAIY